MPPLGDQILFGESDGKRPYLAASSHERSQLLANYIESCSWDAKSDCQKNVVYYICRSLFAKFTFKKFKKNIPILPIGTDFCKQKLTAPPLRPMRLLLYWLLALVLKIVLKMEKKKKNKTLYKH